MEKTPFILSTCFITLLALAQLVRLIWNIPMQVGSLQFPGWTGAIFFIALGLLAAWCTQSLIAKDSSDSDLTHL